MYTVSHSSYAPPVKCPRCFTKMLASIILYDILLYDILPIWWHWKIKIMTLSAQLMTNTIVQRRLCPNMFHLIIPWSLYEGIWKVVSMVFYLSNWFTNPIMCGITLKSYLSSISWHKFNEDIIMQIQKYYCEYLYCLYTGRRKISVEIYNIIFWKVCRTLTIGHEIRYFCTSW